MTVFDEVNAIFERIARGAATEADIVALRCLLTGSEQKVVQLGKYNINIGQGQDIHIGDRIYQEWSEEAIQSLIQVIQKELTGTQQLENPKGRFQNFSQQLFRYFFIEYLELPSLFEIQSRLAINKAIQKGQYVEYQGVFKLWKALLPHMKQRIPKPFNGPFVHEISSSRDFQEEDTKILSDGVVVCLHDVQICPFVNRNPGYQYAYPATSATGKREDTASILVGNDLIITEDIAVRRYGLGDVRFGKVDDRYLVSAVDPPSDLEFAYGLAGKDPRELRAMHMRDLFENRHLWDFGEPWLGFSHTAFGFPVILTSLAYQVVASLLDEYGAVYVKKITGVLRKVPHELPISWSPGIPRLALYIEDRSGIKGVQKPNPFAASAWTVVTNPQTAHYQFAYWPFLVGLDNYQEKLLEATEIIKNEISKCELLPIFEFDSNYNWFSERTPFTPEKIIELYKAVQSKDRIISQKQKQDLTRTFQISTEYYLRLVQKAYEYENGDSAQWLSKLYDADLKCNEGLVEMRFGNLYLARKRFEASIREHPNYTWSRFFNGICLYFSNEKLAALSLLDEAIECAIDDLLQDNIIEDYVSLRKNYSTWYLMIWLWHDFVRSELGVPASDVGQFSSVSEDVYRSREKRQAPENCQVWNVSLQDIVKVGSDAELSLDQVWKYWFEDTYTSPFLTDLMWLVKKTAQGQHDNLKEEGWTYRKTLLENAISERQQISKEPESPFVRILAEEVGKSYLGTLSIAYPKYSTPVLKEIATGNENYALEHLASPSWRERRVSEECLVETGNVERLRTLLEQAEPSIRRGVAHILGEIARRKKTERMPIVEALIKQLKSEKVKFVLFEVCRACVRTSEPIVIPYLLSLIVDEALPNTRGGGIESVLRELGLDAQPTLIEGLQHCSPNVRQYCARILEDVGDENAIPALERMAATDTYQYQPGYISNAEIAKLAISKITKRVSRTDQET